MQSIQNIAKDRSDLACISHPSAISKRNSNRREEIIRVARDLYEEQGIDSTSIKDVTEKVGVTRTLFYHYFPNKASLTTAVLNDLVGDYIEALSYWNDEREIGAIDDALKSVVKILRIGIFEKDSLHRSIIYDADAELYLEFAHLVAEQITDYILETTVKDYEKYHEVQISHLFETFYILIIGTIGFLRNHPDTDDTVIADVIAKTLYLDRSIDKEEDNVI